MYDQTNGGCFQFKKDLKFILLDNGDLLDSIPVGHSVHIKELYMDTEKQYQIYSNIIQTTGLLLWICQLLTFQLLSTQNKSNIYIYCGCRVSDLRASIRYSNFSQSGHVRFLEKRKPKDNDWQSEKKKNNKLSLSSYQTSQSVMFKKVTAKKNCRE